MDREQVIDRLTALRKELEEDHILTDDITLALLLSDVCESLGLNTLECETVLGFGVARAVDQWKLAAVWPIEEETATGPLQESIAVSA